jgi:hypothetical protein
VAVLASFFAYPSDLTTMAMHASDPSTCDAAAARAAALACVVLWRFGLCVTKHSSILISKWAAGGRRAAGRIVVLVIVRKTGLGLMMGSCMLPQKYM